MKLGLLLGAASALQLLGSLILQLIVLAILGAGMETDAWVGAQTAPFVLFSILAAAFQAAWQSRLAVDGPNFNAWLALQRQAQGQLLIVFGSAALALAATASYWTAWIFPGFSEEQLKQTVRMTQILLFGSLLNGHCALLITALRGRERFLAPELVNVLGVFGATVSAAVFVRDFGAEAAAWTLLARSLFIFAILFALAGYPLPAIRNSLQGEAWGHLKPLLAGSAIYKTSPVVDRFWASNAPAGGMTVLNIATLGMSSIASILERMICVPILPRLARLASIADYSSVRTLYRTCCWRVGAIAVIIFIALWLARPVWEVLAREVLNLNPAASHDLWLMCVVLTAYLIPAATGSAIAGSFYALGDSRTVVKVGVAGFVASILIKGAAFAWWGVVGLAAATLVHYLSNMLVLAGLLERRLQHAPGNKDYGRP